MTVRLPMSKRKAAGVDSSGASHPVAPGAKQSRASSSAASQLAGAGKPNDSLMQAIRTLGRLPKSTRTATEEERHLAEKLRKARRQGKLSGEEEAELAAMAELPAMSANDSLMQAIRSLGRLPKETGTATKEERQLAKNLH